MDRRRFTKIIGIFSFFSLLGNELLASIYNIENVKLIRISPPNIHVRHGLFSLDIKTTNSINVKRDIFNRSGLNLISQNRIASITVVEVSKNAFGVLSENKFSSQSKSLEAIKIESNINITIDIDSPCLIFSEIEEFNINNLKLFKTEAAVIKFPQKLILGSDLAQHIFIYRLNQKAD